MNRARTSAIVLLLASAVAAHEQGAPGDLDSVRLVACVYPAMKADLPRPRRLLSALLAWALGRDQRPGPDLAELGEDALSPISDHNTQVAGDEGFKPSTL